LPGEGEIRRVETLLSDKVPSGCAIAPLYGALPFAVQQEAIRPAKSGRKIVLATSIAETSLTIEDIRVVVDAGQARRARYNAGSGMSRLVTERASRAEATQRTGRAGRVSEGTSYRLWTKGEEGSLPAFAPAEIEAADLSGFALELANWGSSGQDLALLTPPPVGALEQARSLLRDLGALDSSDAITPHGRQLARLPLHPRLAHMLCMSGSKAAALAALLNERDVLMRGAPVDLALRLAAIKDAKAFRSNHSFGINSAALAQVKSEAKRLERMTNTSRDLTPAQMLALAYPDRIGARRSGTEPRFILSGGKGAYLPNGDPMANAALIVASDLDGNPRDAKIRGALALSRAELNEIYGDQMKTHDVCIWSKRDNRVLARRQLQFGALVLEDRAWKDAQQIDVARAMLDGVRQVGLKMSDASERFVARVELARANGQPDLPDMSPTALIEALDGWLLPHIGSVASASEWKAFDVLPALRAMLDWSQMAALDKAAPAHFKTPMGRDAAIDYSGDNPSVKIRLQELYGVTRHPTVAGQPLRLELLSPAQRPIQITMDLPNFWRTSYSDVRKDMKSQYPKHPWPEDPTQAEPTLRAKPRKT